MDGSYDYCLTADGRETGVVSAVNPNGFGFISCADSDPTIAVSGAAARPGLSGPAPHAHAHAHPQIFFHLSEISDSQFAASIAPGAEVEFKV